MAYVSSDFPSIQLLSKFVWSYVQKGQITYTVFFLSSPNKQTLVVIKYLVIKIISSTLSLLWQENKCWTRCKGIPVIVEKSCLSHNLKAVSPTLWQKRFRITFTENVNFKLRISQTRKWAGNNCAAVILMDENSTELIILCGCNKVKEKKKGNLVAW